MKNLGNIIKNWRSYPIHYVYDFKTRTGKFYKDGKEWRP